eukprot:Gb_04556 [translate_table: standard]
MYSRELGIKRNNEVGYLTLLEGLEIINKYGLKSIMIQGDSSLVTNQVSKSWTKFAWRLEDLKLKAHKMIAKLDKDLTTMGLHSLHQSTHLLDKVTYQESSINNLNKAMRDLPTRSIPQRGQSPLAAMDQEAKNVPPERRVQG